MKMFATLARAALFASALAGSAAAYADALVATDPIQLGRLSRNNVPQDWSHFELDPATNGEQFPGVINTTTPYHYHTYFYNVGLTPFVQITIDSPGTNTFFSAYQTVYNPTNLAQAWLGDAGSSGNYEFDANPNNFVDGRFFQVVAGINTTLVIVVNETTTNAGLGSASPSNAFTLLVEGFSNSMYDNYTVLSAVSGTQRVPEPSTILLLGFAPLALVARRRASRARAVESQALAA